jgi:hypothetical protein
MNDAITYGSLTKSDLYESFLCAVRIAQIPFVDVFFTTDISEDQIFPYQQMQWPLGNPDSVNPNPRVVRRVLGQL